MKVGKGQGKRTDRSQHDLVSHETKSQYDPSKVSASEFAHLAGTTTKRVMNHLRAWNKAAKEGHVPHSSELEPGQEMVTLLVDRLPDWSQFYVANPQKKQIEQHIPPPPQPYIGDPLPDGSESQVGWNPLYCAPNRTAHEFLGLLAADLSLILSPLPEGYHLNVEDLERLKTHLRTALEMAERYVPYRGKKSKGKAPMAEDRLSSR